MGRKKVDDPSSSAGATFNMTPMIDVTFQLIVVFLCSMKFRTLDQKIEAFLPKDVGLNSAPTNAEVKTKVSVRLKHRPEDSSTTVFILDSRIGTTAAEGIWTTIGARLKEFKERDPKIEGEIDADPDAAHGDVVLALDAFMFAGLNNVVFKGTTLNKSGTWGAQTPKR